MVVTSGVITAITFIIKHRIKKSKTKFLIKSYDFVPLTKIINNKKKNNNAFGKRQMLLATQYKIKILSESEQNGLKSAIIGSGEQGIVQREMSETTYERTFIHA